MKRLITLVLALCLVLSLVPATLAAGSGTDANAAVDARNANSDFYYELVNNYADSDIEHRTEVRWWMAEGGHTDQTLEEEVQAMYDAGFRGVELCQLNVSGMDATVWGYGSEQWNHDFHVVLNKALDLGMTVGITSGTNWSTTNVPGLDPDSQAAMQTVLEMHETVSGGTVLENHAVPTSKTASDGCGGTTTITVKDAAQWVGAYAYKVVDGSANPQVLGEPVDVSSFVTEQDGVRSISWTVPADGEYQIFYLWMQGTHQSASPAVQPSYCVNYLDQQGFEAWSAYFQTHVLNDPALNEKIKNGDVQLFMDSLEYSSGDGMTIYSEHFAEEFQKRKGYDIRPYLVLADGLPGLVTWNEELPTYGTYNLEDAELAQKIRNDLFDVETELYMENYMAPMREWLHGYGIKLRAQISYGKYLEISEPSMAVDYPEAENLNQRNQVDMYRLWSGAAKLENKILSSETGACDGMSYAYDYQKSMQEAYSLYAAGFSRINWHIWSSQWAPQSLWTSGSQKWPGFQSMPLFQTWGMREPAYAEYAELNQHLGRVQELLREGKSRSDIGMVYMKYGQNLCFSTTAEEDMWMQRHDYMLFPSMELQENGYTYDYFSPELLKSDNVYYDSENGTLELAGYKALVLWQNWLTIDGAEAIRDMAKQGLKVVIVDGAAVQTPYNDHDDAALKTVMDEIKSLSNVRLAENADHVLEALQDLGVQPYAGYESQQLLSQVRQDENGNEYLYVYNYCNGSMHDKTCVDHGLIADEDIAVDGTFIPYYIDSWTGEVTQAANYRWENGKTVIHVNLEYGDIALYAFEAVKQEPEHVVASDLDAYVTDDGIVVRATQSGTYETELAYGRKVKTSVDVPEAYDITGWDLTVESWQEGEPITRVDTFADSNGVRGVEQTISTVKNSINVKLDKLTTWDNIPEIGKDVSGRGNYKAVFHWDADAADGAYIDFGKLTQAMQVTINGVKTSDVNMNNPVLDIRPYLVNGENTIEISYGSPMTNVLLSKGYIKVKHTNYTGMGYGNKLWGDYSVDYRSYGPSQAVIVPYVEQNISVLENNDVTVNLTGESDVTVDVAQLSYDVSVSGAEKLATATLTFNVEGLAEPTVEPAEGWYLMGQSVDNGVLTAVIGNNAGLTGEGVIATLTAKTTGKVGTAKVELAKAELSAYVGEGETFTNVIYGTTSVETKIDYSTYDVNHDGVVNQLDLTRAQRYYGKADAVCDVNHDGVVDISDLILILNNYTK